MGVDRALRPGGEVVDLDRAVAAVEVADRYCRAVVREVGALHGRGDRPAEYLAARRQVDSLEALTDAPGVVGHSGPYPVTGAVVEAQGLLATAQAEGRDPAAAAVDQPKLTHGSWVDDGGAVIEAAFADALGVRAGDQITLNSRSFQVVGVAVTAAMPPYPTMSPPGTAENPLLYCVLTLTPATSGRRPLATRAPSCGPRGAGSTPSIPAWSGSPRPMPAVSPQRRSLSATS